MALKFLGEMKVTINDKEYTLRPSFAGCIAAEERLGFSLSKIITKIVAQNAGMREVTAVIYGWLFVEGAPTMSYVNVGMEVLSHGYSKLLPAVGEVVGAAVTGREIDATVGGGSEKK